MAETAFLQYVTLKATDHARTSSADSLEALLQQLVISLMPPAATASMRTLLTAGSFRVTETPSPYWTPQIEGWSGPWPSLLGMDEVVVPCAFGSEDQLNAFREILLTGVDKNIGGEVITGIGADPGGSVADHYCPVHDGSAFSTRKEARRALGLESFHPEFAYAGPNPQTVNVVIVDQGLDKCTIPPANWGGGWAYEPPPAGPVPLPGFQLRTPGTAEARSHGMMIARNVLDVAPTAVLYDFPAIPPERIAQVSMFAHHADVAYQVLIATIDLLRNADARWRGPWIVVNAWGIYDRRTENPLGDYTENTNEGPGGHPLNKVVGRAVADGIDVVFAAGNCGQFTMIPRCGAADRGPGRSIWGANSHPSVLTVGAALSNDTWLGYSAEGPGQPLLDVNKPDVCAPSQFRDSNDATMLNTGTSAACALAAGVLALLRSKWPADEVAPADMKRVLAASAIGSRPAGASGRFGAGIPNAGKAWDILSVGPPWP